MRVVIYSSILPALAGLDAIARSAGFEPVAVITPRPKTGSSDERAQRATDILHGTPADIDVLYAHELASVESLTRACSPDLGLCTGYPWKLPPEVLAIPRLGVVNGHPSRLPRHRGPFPIAWAIREGDAELGLTYHLMDAEYDTGPILAQGTRPMPEDTSLEGLVPQLQELSAELLALALRRILDGEEGEPQTVEGASWAPAFGDDYVELDLTQPAAAVDRQVRAWRWMFSEPVAGPSTTIDGRVVRVLATRLEDPRDEQAVRLEVADGPVWVVEHVPA
jgi:methionyl-tRNA formyltransferase